MPPIILTIPVENLAISAALGSFMEESSFRNLQQVIEIGTSALQKMSGFSAHCMEELLNILDQHNCLHLLSEE